MTHKRNHYRRCVLLDYAGILDVVGAAPLTMRHPVFGWSLAHLSKHATVSLRTKHEW